MGKIEEMMASEKAADDIQGSLQRTYLDDQGRRHRQTALQPTALIVELEKAAA